MFPRWQFWNFGAVLGELFWMLRIRKWGHGWEIVRTKVPFASMVDETVMNPIRKNGVS